MVGDPNGVDYINQFALVSYIPEPLSGFLDRLRCELVPNCFLRAHVTILPPRPLEAPPEKAWMEVREAVSDLHPIDVDLSSVEIFPVSDVIYIGLGSGREELKQLHDFLNKGRVAHKESFNFHPHVTLAQNLTPDQVDEFVVLARRRWEEFQGPRNFRVHTITFVQNTKRHGWDDLAEATLGWGVHREPSLVEA